jgi:choline-sulfatase
MAALTVAIMPAFFGFVTYVNAHFLLRKIDLGKMYRRSFGPIALLLSIVTVTLTAAGYQVTRQSGGFALDDDRSVLLITVDTLRRDYVGAYGEPHAAPTPRMDALAKEGVLFLDATTPMPETAPAHTSMLTGLHPIRHGVLSNSHKLSPIQVTLTEKLRQEGYATGAFVSSFAVHSRTNIDQGFDTFDDDFSPLPGLTHINALSWLTKAWMALGDPASTPWLLERGGKQTNARLFDWLDNNQDRPFFAWVHYFEPHAPYESWGVPGFEENGTPGHSVVNHRALMVHGDEATYTDEERKSLVNMYREEVTYTDQLIGDVLDKLDTLELSSNTLVILTSDHGENLGEHGEDYQHHGLYDQVVRVPLIVRAPGLRAKVQEVKQQVSLLDIPNTVLDYLKMDVLPTSEGVELLGYAEGVRHRSIGTTLVGRRGRSFSEGALVGLRNNNIKYIQDIVTGERTLFHLLDDPGEIHDIISEQPNTVVMAERVLAPEIAAFSKQIEVSVADVNVGEAKMLELMGYTQ